MKKSAIITIIDFANLINLILVDVDSIYYYSVSFVVMTTIVSLT